MLSGLFDCCRIGATEYVRTHIARLSKMRDLFGGCATRLHSTAFSVCIQKAPARNARVVPVPRGIPVPVAVVLGCRIYRGVQKAVSLF